MICLGLNKSAAKMSDSASSISLPSLRETQRWCSMPTPVKHNLRSPELNPSDILNVPYGEDIHKWVQEKYEAYRRAVAKLTADRAALLEGTTTNFESANSDLQGRMLLYYPLENVADGAAEASSKGFFDMEDAPPWDTWVTYSDGAITSWVPEHLISQAQAGIDANPVDCIHWLDARETIDRKSDRT